MTPCSGEGGLPPRTPAISSTSSMNTTACSSSSISVNVSRRARAKPSPAAARRDGNTSTNGHPSREATAFANVVLPVPGGPNRTIARGGLTPYSSARSGSTSGSTTRRSMSCFSCSMPARVSQRPRGEHPAPQLVEQSHLLRLQRHDALEVRQVPRLIAAVAKGRHAGLALGKQRGETMHAPGHQPLLELRQHGAPKAPPAPVVRERQQDDPRRGRRRRARPPHRRRPRPPSPRPRRPRRAARPAPRRGRTRRAAPDSATPPRRERPGRGRPHGSPEPVGSTCAESRRRHFVGRP